MGGNGRSPTIGMIIMILIAGDRAAKLPLTEEIRTFDRESLWE
jgi:hypothetical protein